MTRSLRNAESERFSKGERRIEINLSQGLRTCSHKVIDVSSCTVFATITVGRAAAGDAGVERSWKRGYAGPIQEYDRPNNPLCRKGSRSIPEG